MSKNQVKKEQVQFDDSKNFRQRYHYVMIGIVLSSMLAVFLTILLVYFNIVRLKPNYYATTTSGDIIPLQTLSEPVVSDNYLTQWAALTTRAVFNLDFVHLQQNLEESKKYFTSGGWNSFIAALNKSGVSKLIRDKKLMTSAVITKTPVILNKSVIAARYSWLVQMPVLVTYTSASESVKKSLIATLMIRRVPVLGASQGIQIANIILQPNIPGSNLNKIKT